jgi:hypothetical protein
MDWGKIESSPGRLAAAGHVAASLPDRAPLDAPPAKARTAMDEDRFDRLARSLGGRGTSRRSVLSGLASGGLAAVGLAAGAAAAERCPRAQRCGKDCCKRSRCFAKRISPNNGKVLSYGCCPPDKLCKSADLPDQCCYPDEVCQPQGAADRGSNCCRRCGVDSATGQRICCSFQEKCVDGRCRQLETARLPRRRR